MLFSFSYSFPCHILASSCRNFQEDSFSSIVYLLASSFFSLVLRCQTTEIPDQHHSHLNQNSAATVVYLNLPTNSKLEPIMTY